MKIQQWSVDRQSSPGVLAAHKAAQAWLPGTMTEDAISATTRFDQRPRTENFLWTNFPDGLCFALEAERHER
jgi:hypothetical protein